MFTITIIGTGNAATQLGKAFLSAGHSIRQVAGRNTKEGKKLAGILKSTFVQHHKLDTDADFYILAVSDDQIPSVAESIPIVKGIVLHTSGTVNINTLSNHIYYGVLYPLQTLRKEDVVKMKTAPVLIEANKPASLKKIKMLAESISDEVLKMKSADRLKIHLAAVIVNNFTNHLYSLAWEFLKKEKLDPSVLIPLIKETTLSLETGSPAKNQTGPAKRNDTTTIKKHLQLIKKNKSLHKIYKELSASIISLHSKK